MRKLMSSAAVVAALLGAGLGGCAHDEPAPVVAPPEPAYIPPPAPPPPPMPAPPDMGTGAAPPDIDRGLPVCPGDPRCKKPGG